MPKAAIPEVEASEVPHPWERRLPTTTKEANTAGIAPEAPEAPTAEGVCSEVTVEAPDASVDEEITVEKTPDIAPEAAKIASQEEAKTVKVAPEIEKKEVLAISTEVSQVPTPPIKEAKVPEVSAGEGTTYEADELVARDKLIREAKAGTGACEEVVQLDKLM